MLKLVALLALAQAVSEPLPPSEFDEVFELELTGASRSATAEYFVDFEGTLHVWAWSELGLSVRVEDVDTGEILGTDEDTGAESTPYVKLQVELNDELAITVSSANDAALGAGELHIVAAPETDATREAASSARERIAEARRLQEQGELDVARAVLDEALAQLLSPRDARHSEVLAGVAWDLGFVAYRLGHVVAARSSFGAAREHRERTLPGDHPELLRARANLANMLSTLGDLAGARALREAVLEARERTLPADHTELLRARANLAVTLYTLGDLTAARALQEAVLEASQRTLHADHPDLLAARANLANTLFTQGDLAGARALQEAVLEASERMLPADHPDLLLARAHLAATLSTQGDLAGARALQEAVLEASERTLPADHPDLLGARANLANTLFTLGDLGAARALRETVLDASERTLPADHPALLRARSNLANTLFTLGDLGAARALREAVLEARERALPADHPELLHARTNLAVTLLQLGDLAAARALQEAVLDASERTLLADHPDLIAARANLAATLSTQGDLAGARALREAVLQAFERTLPRDHPELLRARGNLAGTLSTLGDLTGARALQEAVLEASERTLPADHPDLLAARANLANTLSTLGDQTAAGALVSDQVAGMRARALASLAFAARETGEVVRSELVRLDGLLYLSRSASSALQAPVFELQETLRVVALEAARAVRSTSDPEVAALLAEARSVRAALGDLVARTDDERDEEELSAELTRLVRERDRLERRASQRLAEGGVVTRPVEVHTLRHALGRHGAVVAYRRVAHWYQDEQTNKVVVGDDHLLAHLLRPDGALTRIDLGDAVELEEVVVAWRVVCGVPLLRGVRVEGDEGSSEEVLGARLRKRLLDPVLAELEAETTRLHVCADDLVFLVPLDALPYEEGRVGDVWTIVNEVSYARLMVPGEPLDTAPGFFALGGVDYDAGGTEAVDDAAGTSRAAMPDRFTRLLQTRIEAQTAGLLFGELCGAEPVIVTKADATKDALFQHAAGKRYLHLATHGWFASETVPSAADDDRSGGEGDWTRMSAQERVTGLAPMLLCGIALAGANNGRDSLGRMNGILTAEELCSLDLSACDLAVLSACETNVGIRRAGQGIQSLQAALYAAGARSSITSLWKVDDAATRRLMEHFYTNLWEAEMPKHRALWEAKRALRDDGAPVRDWAGWVLTGDPD